MKIRIAYIVMSMCAMLAMTSCLREDTAPVPTMRGVKLYMVDSKGADSLITEPTAGRAVKFVVETDGDMCAVWPGGIRTIMKKKQLVNGVAADSIDMFNNPVLVNSDQYGDYGLVGAKGLKTTLSADGWYCSYTYPNAGQFEAVVVVTNHGYNDANFQQRVHEIGTITVRPKP